MEVEGGGGDLYENAFQVFLPSMKEGLEERMREET